MASLFVGLITFFVLIALLALLGYQLMCFADLEFDYTDPLIDSTARINKVVMPEFVVQAVFCFVCIATGQGFLCLMSLPNLHYNFKLYRSKRHLVDVTEIFNKLNSEKKQRLIKFGYVILIFVVFLSRLLCTVGVDDC
ncbi:hypothetical protein E1A91_A08G150500v1 [Gossypium mustelinum]|uniref:Cornichon family protein n=1 Tax=Gossypium mustelinum TaxID=34275 RepID=A0A5D2Y8Y9_GOSMU|nr:hypothetical protein E1A91_A08G150500v1 [Gossypium mustelinum]